VSLADISDCVHHLPDFFFSGHPVLPADVSEYPPADTGLSSRLLTDISDSELFDFEFFDPEL
jgi:hypothetical protein